MPCHMKMSIQIYVLSLKINWYISSCRRNTYFCEALYVLTRIQSVRIDNSTFERVEGFKYLGTTLTNQNSIVEEIKSRLRSGNACYHLGQNLLSSRLLSKNLKINIYRTIILPVVLYRCETWSLTLREERKLRVFQNMVLRRTRRDEVTRGMEEIA